MQIKLFGKELFSMGGGKSRVEYLLNDGVAKASAESKFLPDFEKMSTGGNGPSFIVSDYIQPSVLYPVSKLSKKKGVAKKKVVEKLVEKLTPKGVYELRALNDVSFELNVNPEYIDQQVSDFKDKLTFLKSEEYDMRRGTVEIASILMRLENRKKYGNFKDFYEQYPYTTKSKIEDVLKTHDHLRSGEVAQFVADMPKDAIEAMKGYNKETEKLCGKQAVFYIIADKKDFEKSNKRRDPILLAQSPFGHIYQIIGAWDEEMMFLEEL